MDIMNYIDYGSMMSFLNVCTGFVLVALGTSALALVMAEIKSLAEFKIVVECEDIVCEEARTEDLYWVIEGLDSAKDQVALEVRQQLPIVVINEVEYSGTKAALVQVTPSHQDLINEVLDAGLESLVREVREDLMVFVARVLGAVLPAAKAADKRVEGVRAFGILAVVTVLGAVMPWAGVIDGIVNVPAKIQKLEAEIANLRNEHLDLELTLEIERQINRANRSLLEEDDKFVMFS